MIDVKKESEKNFKTALLVGIQDQNNSSFDAREHLNELSELARTLGIEQRHEIFAIVKDVNPGFYVGSGKAEEIANFAKECLAEIIIFDCELSPSQQRNLEELSKLPVIDRQEVIIDIFASRAKTKEAVLQVELARYKYFLPRLKRAWTHLSRQRGGALGTRGEGEQQIEVDRRIIKRKISILQKELLEIQKRRQIERNLSEKSQIPRIAIVGYTNAGKSSLLRTLTNADVYIEDKLFATLDTTSRKLKLNSGNVIVSDTVGFIRKLPHTLVEAFKSTLEEALYADILVHVLDISSPYWEEHMKTTISVLDELGAGEKEIITVFNKTDILDDSLKKAILKSTIPDGIFISAKTSEGIEELKKAIEKKIEKFNLKILIKIPPQRHDIVALAHRTSKVLSIKYLRNGYIEMLINVPKIHKTKFENFKTK
ncbi:MAG TPA: GTPase HflX [Victivallales bacterium]|nr:GTPase HflX [Victivallales bacterium]HPO91411.1 GTPase HflX [Victivallales bacterium]HRR29183.1 GTPase HflX [Victivallales bacterium]HRU01128.1 GTPase HflX [Victivallales bacterium]